jgi:flagellar M-ring protein FliF
MVQVNAELNFDQVEKTMETYDPDQQVVVSEQTMVSNNTGKSLSDTSAQNNQSSTTNYEIGKTIERVVQGSGNVTRLSIAAVINDIPKEVQKGDQTEIVFEPRSPEQLKKLEELIKNAVGLDPQRNDQISIVNLPFQTTPATEFVEESTPWFKDTDGISNLLLVIIAIAGALFLLRGLMSKLKSDSIFIGNVDQELAVSPALSTHASRNLKVPQVLNEMRKKKDLLPVGDLEDDISDEAINKKNRQEKISHYISKNPTEAAKLINAWLHEDE